MHAQKKKSTNDTEEHPYEAFQTTDLLSHGFGPLSKPTVGKSSFDDEYDMMNYGDDDEDNAYYYIDEHDLENNEYDDEDDEYYFIDEYDADNDKYDEYDEDILSAYIDDNEDYGTDILSEDKTKYPPAITIDNSWGLLTMMSYL
ncbi:hypothetical protein EDC94DRAFT_652275 [Helicostylum pulchrum]|nr:hypothetical protein EDC94DRAFT_652275 [Helicostylum pulchrum]